ncbi:MAG TPA: polymer-forming cytoskeletal protein [Acidobacteriota bacterium]|nr:polymer-forming cytoskeletal protein [Acidobacteriota bacterium]
MRIAPQLKIPKAASTTMCVLCVGAFLSLAPTGARTNAAAAATVAPSPAQDPTEPAPASQQAPAAAISAPPERPRFINVLNERVRDVGGDIFLSGQDVSLAGRVGHNAFLFAQTSTVAGHVEGDVFAWVAGITVSGEIDGDLYVGTAGATILEGAVIHGNIICLCGSLNVDGTVGGAVLGSAGGASIGGTVHTIDMETGQLELADTAVIHGDVTYESNEEARIANSAQIGGSLSWNRESGDENEDDTTQGLSFWSIAWKVWVYLSNLIVGAVFLLLGGAAARAPAASLRNSPAPGLGFGFVVAVVFPVACLVAVALIVTLPLGVVGLLLFGLGAFLARLVTAQFVGDWLLRRLGLGDSSEYLSLAVGLLLLFLVAAIPYVGFLVRLVTIILGIGGIYLALRAGGFPTAPAPPPAPSATAG